MVSNLFSIERQLVFYGAYHVNKVNVRIHMLCVPIIIWTLQIGLSSLPTPSFFPDYKHDFNSMLSFKSNWAAVQAIVYFVYYFAMLPTGALLYAPHSIVSLLSATAVARDPKNIQYAFALHIVSWLAQFYGHGVHERRAPALLDNVIGAFVLAPFFVHLELLFELGYFPTLHKDVMNGIGTKVAKDRRANAQTKRVN